MPDQVLVSPRLLDTERVMQMCSCGRHAARALILSAGPVRLGRSLRVRIEDLDRELERRKEEGRST